MKGKNLFPWANLSFKQVVPNEVGDNTVHELFY